MDIELNIVSRVILIGICTIILGNLLSKLLGGFFNSKGPSRKSNIDLDVLVRRQEQILRAKEGLSAGSAQNKTDKTFDSEIEAKYAEKIKGKSEDKSKYIEILELFDESRWGEGKQIKELRSKLVSKYKVDFSAQEIVLAIKNTSKKNLLLGINRDELLSKDEIYSVIENYLIHSLILSEVNDEKYNLLLLISKNNNTSISSTVAGVIIALQEIIGENFDYAEALNAKVAPSFKNLNDFLYQDKRSKVRDLDSLFTQIAFHSNIIDAITPMKRIEKKDIKSAYRMFGATESTNFELIKKRYKKMAQKKHPDKLNSIGIEGKLQDIATENFAIMQEAYDMIKKELK